MWGYISDEHVLELATVATQHSEYPQCLCHRTLFICCDSEKIRVSEVAQWEKILAAKPGDQSSEFPPHDPHARHGTHARTQYTQEAIR